MSTFTDGTRVSSEAVGDKANIYELRFDGYIYRWAA